MLNYKTAKEKLTFKKAYLKELLPIVKNLLELPYIDLKRLTYFADNRLNREGYKIFLTNAEELKIDKEGFARYKNKINGKKIFTEHKEKLAELAKLNITNIPTTLSLQLVKMVARLDSLILQMDDNDEEYVLKNIKEIFKCMRVIDKKLFELKFV